jgi:hypothetical protein
MSTPPIGAGEPGEAAGPRPVAPGNPDVWSGPTNPAPPPSAPPTAFTSEPTPAEPNAGLPRRGRARAVGTVASMRQRAEMHRRLPSAQVINFRLERYDDRGNRLQPVPVEMRGMTITGYIAEGERVRLSGRFHNGTLYTKQVDNLTTGGGVSTQTTGRWGRWFGRRAELAIVAAVLVVLVGCVRFVPQIYINTPFGLHEYRSDVHSTCEHLAAIAASTGDLNFNTDGTIDRSLILDSYKSKVANTKQTYSLLFSHVTPFISRSRRDKVESLMPALNSYLAKGRRQILALPHDPTISQLSHADAALEPRGAAISARINDAMTQLAGGTCHVD